MPIWRPRTNGLAWRFNTGSSTYYFNDWNNTHEGDWEMIQLTFVATTAEGALREEPVSVAYAQHAGGERADWTASKLRTEDGHPVVYVANGSHASHFESAIYLGYGESGAGFGCDDAANPTLRVPVEARLIPTTVDDQDNPLAWITFEGRWGEEQHGHWNGARGPNTKKAWLQPFSWEDGLRASSLKVANRDAAGPDPVNAFCRVVGMGATVLNVYDLFPRAVYTALALAILIIAWLLWLTAPTLAEAAVLYATHARVFIPIGLAVIPIALAVNVLQILVTMLPPAAFVLKLMDRSPTAGAAVVLAVSGVEQLVLLLVVVPAVVSAVAEMRAGRSISPPQAYQMAVRRLPELAPAVLRAAAIVFGLAISVIGLPLAIRQAVRWRFVEQAVVLEGAAGPNALALSARVVTGKGWRTLANAIVLAAVGAAPGPLLGIVLLVITRPRSTLSRR